MKYLDLGLRAILGKPFQMFGDLGFTGIKHIKGNFKYLVIWVYGSSHSFISFHFCEGGPLVLSLYIYIYILFYFGSYNLVGRHLWFNAPLR